MFQRGSFAIKVIREFIQSFERSSRREQYGFARILQKVLLKPEVNGRLRWELQLQKTNYYTDVYKKILDFRALLPALGKSIYPLEVITKGIIEEDISKDGLVVAKLDAKELSSDLIHYLIQVEKVHKVQTGEDLIQRLIGNRVGYGLYHPKAGSMPLAMLYVALTDSLPKTLLEIQEKSSSSPILNPSRAIFYTISLCHLGARGLGMGQKLIMGALPMISREFPTVNKFQTLSPVIRYKEWLKGEQRREHSDSDTSIEDHVRLCKEFLKECHQGRASVIDPVASFHFKNGAILDKILPDADSRSTKSFKLMASYIYEPSKLKERSEKYQKIITNK